MAELGGPRHVGRHQVDAGHPVGASVAATSHRSNQADPVGDDQRRRGDDRREVSLPAGPHHHFRVEGDNQPWWAARIPAPLLHQGDHPLDCAVKIGC